MPWSVLFISAILNILLIAIGVPVAFIACKRQKGIEKRINEIYQLINKLELDDIQYKILEGEKYEVSNR